MGVTRGNKGEEGVTRGTGNGERGTGNKEGKLKEIKPGEPGGTWGMG